MRSSPASPRGTTRPASSVTQTTAPSTGVPIGGGAVSPSSAPTWCTVVTTVASAGPYALCTRAVTCGAGRRRSRSPPTTRWRRSGSSGQGRSRTVSASGVGRMATDTLARRHHAVRASGSQRTSSGGTLSVPPEVSAAHSSLRCGSKETPISRLCRSPGRAPVYAWYQSSSEPSDGRPTATAFGVPVEPEVSTA